MDWIRGEEIVVSRKEIKGDLHVTVSPCVSATSLPDFEGMCEKTGVWSSAAVLDHEWRAESVLWVAEQKDGESGDFF